MGGPHWRQGNRDNRINATTSNEPINQTIKSINQTARNSGGALGNAFVARGALRVFVCKQFCDEEQVRKGCREKCKAASGFAAAIIGQSEVPNAQEGRLSINNHAPTVLAC